MHVRLLRSAILALFPAGLAMVALWVAATSLGWSGGSTARGLTDEASAPVKPPKTSSSSPDAANGAAISVPEPDVSERIPERELVPLLRDATASERPALEDGVVTVEEYNGALLRAQECTVEGTRNLAGVVVKDVEVSDGKLRFGGMSAASYDLMQKAHQVHIGCVGEHFDHVAVGLNSAAADRRLERLWAATAECMRNAGANPPQGADWQQLLATSISETGNRMLYNRCSGEAQTQDK